MNREFGGSDGGRIESFYDIDVIVRN